MEDVKDSQARQSRHARIRIITVLVIAVLAAAVYGGIWFITQDNWCDRVGDAERDLRSGFPPHAVVDRWELDKGEPTSRFAYFARGYGSDSDVRSALVMAGVNCRAKI